MISFADPLNGVVIQLRNPLLGDKVIVSTPTIVKVTMAGSLTSRRTTPPTTKFKLEFADLSRPEAVKFQDFLKTAAGNKLSYVDIYATQWVGYIVSGPHVFTSVGKGPPGSGTRSESTTVEIEFEGSPA